MKKIGFEIRSIFVDVLAVKEGVLVLEWEKRKVL